jgi:hypothetical protein
VTQAVGAGLKPTTSTMQEGVVEGEGYAHTTPGVTATPSVEMPHTQAADGAPAGDIAVGRTVALYPAAGMLARTMSGSVLPDGWAEYYDEDSSERAR